MISASGTAQVALFRDGTALKVVGVSGWTAPAGTAVRVRVQATGTNPTALRARVWRTTTAEPATWNVTASDATAALQGPGAVGVRSCVSSSATATPVVTTVDDLVVTDTASPPANRPPTASFVVAANGQTVAFDGTASSDPEGPVASWAWSFGDGTTGSGSRTSHSFADPGTYAVTLTVLDAAATSGSTATSLVVAAGSRPTQAQWLGDVTAALDGATAYVDARQGVSRPAIVLDIDNTALQSYHQPFAATPAVFEVAQRAQQDGYTVLFATGRSARHRRDPEPAQAGGLRGRQPLLPRPRGGLHRGVEDRLPGGVDLAGLHGRRRRRQPHDRPERREFGEDLPAAELRLPGLTGPRGGAVGQDRPSWASSTARRSWWPESPSTPRSRSRWRASRRSRARGSSCPTSDGR